VESGRSGLLAPPGDVRAFAHEVERLAIDSALRMALADGGRKRAAQFSVDRMASGASAVYDMVLARATAAERAP